MRRALVVCTLVLAAVPVRANDKWEFGIAGGDDDDNTVNALAPGRWQPTTWRVGTTPDQDWFGSRSVPASPTKCGRRARQ